jgi:hypothetical protein
MYMYIVFLFWIFCCYKLHYLLIQKCISINSYRVRCPRFKWTTLKKARPRTCQKSVGFRINFFCIFR